MIALAVAGRAMEGILFWSCSLIFAVLASDVFYQVLDRNVLGGGSLWTFEVAQLTVSWCVFLGAAIAVRRRLHYVVDIFPASFRRTNFGLKLLSNTIVTAFAFIMLSYGIDLVRVGARIHMNTLPLTMAWNYVPIAISGGFMLLFMIEVWLRTFRDFREVAEPREQG